MNGCNTSVNCPFSRVFKDTLYSFTVHSADRQLNIIDNYMDCAESGYLLNIDNIRFVNSHKINRRKSRFKIQKSFPASQLLPAVINFTYSPNASM
jgi:hypothetical protein